MKKHALSIAALVVGIVALGLAVIPGIVLNRAVPLASEAPEKPLPAAESKDGVTFKYKDFSVTFRGKKSEDDKTERGRDAVEDAPARNDAPVAVDRQRPGDGDDLKKWFTIAAVSCSLIGLVLGPISWVNQRQPILSLSAIAICCLALVWQYVVLGIVVGVAMAVLLLLLSLLDLLGG